MSFPLIPMLLACLLWCAGLACTDGRSASAGAGMDAWEKAAGGSVIIAAVCENGPVQCAAKLRCIEPVWPHAIADSRAGIRFNAETLMCFRMTSVAPDLEQVPWVGVIELRV